VPGDARARVAIAREKESRKVQLPTAVRDVYGIELTGLISGWRFPIDRFHKS
jgi:hypothetical protein